MEHSDEAKFYVEEHHIIGIIIFLVAGCGFCGNLVVALFTRRLPSMNNAFGKLMASQATGEVVLCGTFTFFCAPMVFFKIDWFWENSRQAGFFNLIAYDICIWSHLFIAINRLCAISFPMRYDKLFGKTTVRTLIVISWTLAIVTAVVLYKLHDCDFYFSDTVWAFIFTQNKVCGFISWNIDFFKDLSIVIVIAVVDTITIIMIFVTKKSARVSNVQQLNRRRNEINFVKQAVLQGVVFVFELFTYFYLAWTMESKMSKFLLTTVAWILVHTSDGFIIIAFNREFRRLMLRPLTKYRIHSSIPSNSLTRPCVQITTSHTSELNH